MNGKDGIEFYHDKKMIATLLSSMVLPVGCLINIRKKTWRVTKVTFALDYADDMQLRRMTCNVDIEPNK